MAVEKRRITARRVFLLLILPLLFAGGLGVLVASGLISVPLLAGFASLAAGGIVFAVATGASFGTALLLWLMQKTLERLSKKSFFGNAGVGLLVSIGILSSVIYIGMASTAVLTWYFAPLGLALGPLGVTLLAVAASALLLSGVFVLAHIIRTNTKKKDLQAVQQQKAFIPPKWDSKRKDGPTSGLHSMASPPKPTTKPSTQAHTTTTTTTVISTLTAAQQNNKKSVNPNKTADDFSLPKIPFTTKDKRPQGKTVDAQWTEDKPLVEGFFSKLCKKVIQAVAQSRDEKNTVLTLAAELIKQCNLGLLARYHPDKLTEEDKGFLEENILVHPLFTVQGDALYQAIIQCDAEGMASILTMLDQSFVKRAKEFDEIIDILTDCITHSKTLSNDYREIKAISTQTRKVIAEANKITENVIEGYREIHRKQAEEAKKQEQCREQLRDLQSKIQSSQETRRELEKSLELESLEKRIMAEIDIPALVKATIESDRANIESFTPLTSGEDKGSSVSSFEGRPGF